MADTIAELIVKIGGDASALKTAVADAQGHIKTLGSGIKNIGVLSSAVVTAPIVAIGAFAMKSASDVNGAMRQITRELGVTGEEADFMKEKFKNLFSTVPEDAKTVSSALIDVSQLMRGVLGPDIEIITRQLLDLSRLTQTDLTGNTKGAAAAFNEWSIASRDMSGKLDELYIIQQATGQSIGDYGETLGRAAGISKAAGMSFEQTAIILAQMSQSGIQSRQALAMLNAVVMQAEKSGKNAGVVWSNLVTKFKDPAYKATAADIEILGSNTEKFAGLVRSGTLDYTRLIQGMKDSKGSIEAAAEATRTFGERMQIFKNQLMLAFAPLGSAIFAVLTNVLEAAKPLLAFVAKLGDAFSKLPKNVQMIIVVIGGLAAAVGPVLIIIGSLIGSLAPLAGIVLPIITAIGAGGLAGVFTLLAGVLVPFLPIILAVGAALLALAGIGAIVGFAILKMTGIWDNLRASFYKWLDSVDWSAMGKKAAELIIKGIKGVLSLGKLLLEAFTGGEGGGGVGTVDPTIKTTLKSAATEFITAFKTEMKAYLDGQFKTDLKNGVQAFGEFLLIAANYFFNNLMPKIIIAIATFGVQLLLAAASFFANFGLKIVQAIIGFGLWLLTAAAQFFLGSEWSTRISAALIGFGLWLLTAAMPFFTSIPGQLVTAVAGLGNAMINAAQSFFSTLASAVSNAVTSLNGAAQTVNQAIQNSSAYQNAVNTPGAQPVGNDVYLNGNKIYSASSPGSTTPPASTANPYSYGAAATGSACYYVNGKKVCPASYQHGGYVPKTGLSYLHAGEYVVPKGKGEGRGGTTYNIRVSGIKMEDVANEVIRKLKQREMLQYSYI